MLVLSVSTLEAGWDPIFVLDSNYMVVQVKVFYILVETSNPEKFPQPDSEKNSLQKEEVLNIKNRTKNLVILNLP